MQIFPSSQWTSFFITRLLCITFAIHSGNSTFDESHETCQHALDLHGRGLWGKALELFTKLADSKIQHFPQEGSADIIDCMFGAALSLNALGMHEASLSAFRLSQRLQVLHPAGSALLAAKSQQSCRDYAVRLGSPTGSAVALTSSLWLQDTHSSRPYPASAHLVGA